MLRDAPQFRASRIYCSQPHRIAAAGLHARLTTLGYDVGLRMGHGVREGDGPTTRLCYCTTGYLTALLRGVAAADSNAGAQDLPFDVLIIDECHERSIDADLLFLLARRMLTTDPSLSVVLMSATAHFEQYRAYFAQAVGSEHVSHVIHVGARRFPRQVSYLDDLCAGGRSVHWLQRLPEAESRRAATLMDACMRELSVRGGAAAGSEGAEALWRVPQAILSGQLKLAAAIAIAATRTDRRGKGGASTATAEAGSGKSRSAVLVFVAGWSDIADVADEIARLGGSEYACVPLHGEMPAEEQLGAFRAAPAGKSKIIVATNAAESSLTLPDVDVVVDTGQQKQLVHDPTLGTILLRTWVSQAAAEQRAGRTGRVRAGTVVRLYPTAYQRAMAQVDVCAMRTQPLDNAVLQLRATLASEPVEDLLNAMIEPPPPAPVERALASLAGRGMVIDASRAQLTPLGALAANLPVDVAHARLLGMSLAMSCADLGVVLAAALSLPSSPFRDARRVGVTECDGYNARARDAFLSRTTADEGVLSEPIALVMLFAQYERVRRSRRPPPRDRAGTHSRNEGGRGWAKTLEAGWCHERGVIPQRMRDFETLVASLRQHLCRQLRRIKPSDLAPLAFAADTAPAKLTALRVLLLAAFPDSVVVSPGPTASSLTSRAARLGDGSSADVWADEIDLVSCGSGQMVALDEAAVAKLLPRPPLRWRSFVREELVAAEVETGVAGEEVTTAVEDALEELRAPSLVLLEAIGSLPLLWCRSARTRVLQQAAGSTPSLSEWLQVKWAGVDGAVGWKRCATPISGFLRSSLPKLARILAERALPMAHAAYGAPDYRMVLTNLPSSWHSSAEATALTVAVFGARAALLPAAAARTVLFEGGGGGREGGDSGRGGGDGGSNGGGNGGNDGNRASGDGGGDGGKSPLFESRALGVRLALSLAAGYKDRHIHTMIGGGEMVTTRGRPPTESVHRVEVRGGSLLTWRCVGGLHDGEKAMPSRHSYRPLPRSNRRTHIHTRTCAHPAHSCPCTHTYTYTYILPMSMSTFMSIPCPRPHLCMSVCVSSCELSQSNQRRDACVWWPSLCDYSERDAARVWRRLDWECHAAAAQCRVALAGSVRSAPQPAASHRFEYRAGTDSIRCDRGAYAAGRAAEPPSTPRHLALHGRGYGAGGVASGGGGGGRGAGQGGAESAAGSDVRAASGDGRGHASSGGSGHGGRSLRAICADLPCGLPAIGAAGRHSSSGG